MTLFTEKDYLNTLIKDNQMHVFYFLVEYLKWFVPVKGFSKEPDHLLIIHSTFMSQFIINFLLS